MSWKSFWKGVGNFGLGLLKSIPVVGNVVGAIENAVTSGKPKNLEDSSTSGWVKTLSGSIPGLVDAGTSMMVNNISRNGDINAQKELMSYQNTLQGQNYERELADKKALIADDRDYNDIGSQMARAEQAGVSPLAALGVSSGNSISAQAPSHGGVSGHHVANNLLATISTLKGLQMQKELNDAQVYRTRQAGKLDEQKAETEVYNTIMAKLQSETYTEETKARIREMLERGDLAGAQRELAIAQTKTEGHKQSNLDANTILASQQALKTQIEREYEEKYNRTMSNGLSNVIDSFADYIFGNPKWRERVLDATTNGRGLNGALTDLLDQFMKLNPLSMNEEIRKILFDLLLKIFM